jgi:hypothetical protein
MNQLTFTKLTEESEPNEVAWHNMKIADEIHSSQWFAAAATGWLKHNKINNFQEFETELRKRNFNTHLFAVEKKDDSNIELTYPGQFDKKETEDRPLKYECNYSCKPIEHALKEIQSVNGSYDDNFAKLKFSGVISPKNTENVDEIGAKKVHQDENSPFQLVTNNKARIDIKKVTDEEALNGELEKIKIIYGKDPQMAIVGTSNDGGAIMGFAIEGKLVSGLGVCMSRDKDMKLIRKIVSLNECF